MTGLVIRHWQKEEETSAEEWEPLAGKAAIDETSDPFARQKLVSWWDQDKIASARVLVMGAGAIGNETLKNLALLGFRQIFICDMDRIELSNLSRTVLFDRQDEGKEKAEVAADRLRNMCLADDPRIDFFTGDIMYGLGSGIFRHFDLILGCLDNDATRFYMDRQCTRFQKPWINAGISELSSGLQLFNTAKTGVCFHCGRTKEEIVRVMSRRASCGKAAISDLQGGKIPTIQVASALVSALQTQEAVKYVCGKPVAFGHSYYFQGTKNAFEESRMREDPTCIHHTWTESAEVTELAEGTSRMTMGELLDCLEKRWGASVTVDLSEEQGRDYIRTATCVHCGREVPVNVPRYRFKDSMAVCTACRHRPMEEGTEPWLTGVRSFDKNSDGELLAMTLEDLGIPPLHVLTVYDGEERVHSVELTGDLARVAPSVFGKTE